MTTQTTTFQTSTKSMRAFIGAAAATLAVLGGALLWQARPTSETVAPVASTTVSTVNEGIAPMGGMAELYAEQETDMRANVERESRLGGMAELYREQARVHADVGR